MQFKITLLFIFCFSVLEISAQNQSWDSTQRPGQYQYKTGFFKSYPDSKKDIIFLGNSITAYPDWNELLKNRHVRNRGISGDITFGVLERLDEITGGKPKKVFVLIGINDISRNIPDTVILANYKKIINHIKRESPRTKIYFQTLLPVNNEFTQFKNHYNKDAHILWLNEQIRDLGRTEGITVIDLHPHFLDSEEKLNKNYTLDGLHINAEGYNLWAKILKPYL